MSTSTLFHASHLTDEDLVQMACRGEREAADILIRRYRPVVERRARALRVIGADEDDLVQEGLIGLCGAIQQYRSERLHSFRPFAEICAIRKMCTAARSASSVKNSPLNRAVCLHAQSAEAPDSADDYGALFAFWGAHLTSLEFKVVSLLLEGFTYGEIGAKLECPTKRVDNALQRARKKLSIAMKT